MQSLRTLSFLSLCALFILLPLGLSAQQAGSDPLFIDVQPSSPTPGQKTTITIDSSVFDLGQATIAWRVNGSPVAAGAGVRTITFTMGPAGKTTIVDLTIAPRTGTPFNRTFTFRPGSVTLLWEADTYVPPFFKGKSLYTPGATIRVQAIADVRDSAGNVVPSSELTYKWQMGGDAYADRSGLGRDTLIYDGNILGGSEEVGVDVIRKDGSKAASQVILIKDESPKILFYKKDPLRGVLYDSVLGENTKITETETTIVAEPYYVSGNSRNNPSFMYAWMLNDKEIAPQGSDPAVLTLRQTGAQSGNASLSFSIQNTNVKMLLQEAQARITLLLGTQNSGFFGF